VIGSKHMNLKITSKKSDATVAQGLVIQMPHRHVTDR